MIQDDIGKFKQSIVAHFATRLRYFPERGARIRDQKSSILTAIMYTKATISLPF
jgi:hypothetical protein